LLKIFLSNEVTCYTRTYIRLPDVIANVGGFLDLAMIFIKFCFDFYVENAYSSFLYTKLFNFGLQLEEDNKSQQDHINNISSSKRVINDINNVNDVELKKINIFNSNKVNKEHKNNKGIGKYLEAKSPYNKDIKNIISYKKKPYIKFELSYWERCCCYNKTKETISNKKELFEIADSIIDKKSEIFLLWQSIDELNLLKKIILNENQCFMLDNKSKKFLRGKSISNSNKVNVEQIGDSFDINLHDENKNIESRSKLIEYYKMKKAKSKINDIDDMLWLYLDETIKLSIEEELNK